MVCSSVITPLLVCDGGQTSKLQQDVDMLMSSQQQIVQQLQQTQQQLQTLLNNTRDVDRLIYNQHVILQQL